MKKKKRRKRRGRLRVDRIIMVLSIIIFIVFAIKFISYVVYNNKIYNTLINSDNNKIEVRAKYNNLKLYKKTITLFKESKRILVIKDKKYSIEIPSDKLENGIDLNVNLYNDKLEYSKFPNIKAYFIDNKDMSKYASSITVKLPRYLRKNGVVDIYGVQGEKVTGISLNQKIDNEVSINIDKKYDKYFIVYVKLEDMKISSKLINKGSVVNLNIKYIPETATIKDYEYTKIGDIFMLNDNNQIIAKEEGTGKITIRHKTENIEKTVDVTVENQSIKQIDGLTYVNGILVVNKTYSVPKDYDPGKLDDDALKAFEEMREAASKEDITLWIASGYRSYKTQEELYNGYIKEDGQEKTDLFSAKPGHSEHQTGLAMDLNIIDSSFEGTQEAIWIEKHAHEYGFIIRYPKGKEDITGYKYEPWHVRYLGIDAAKKVYDSNATLEEYLGIDSKYST